LLLKAGAVSGQQHGSGASGNHLPLVQFLHQREYLALGCGTYRFERLF
jgi:hypothetical protein